MSANDPYTFLKTLIATDEAKAQSRASQVQPPLIVTVSRDFGSRGDEIARMLANQLAIPLYDRQILERSANRAHVDPARFEGLDSFQSSSVSSFIFSLLTGSGGDLQTYQRALFEAVLELAQRDCVLVGRGAHLILSGKRTFRVRIVGSRMVCAKRVSEEMGIPLEAAERKVYEINNKRHKSIENLFKDSYEHCSLNYAKNFDLIINTDRISAEGAVPIIMMAMQQAGFDLQRTAPKA
jgi:hypothetical protein